MSLPSRRGLIAASLLLIPGVAAAAAPPTPVKTAKAPFGARETAPSV